MDNQHFLHHTISRTIMVSVVILSFFAETKSQTIKKMDDATWNAIDQVVEDSYYSHFLKGVSVAVVYGGNKNDGGDAFNIYTKSLLASVSKTITGVLAMRLIQNGDIGIDDPISMYLPDYNNTGITIRHLLDHQSGISHYSNCPSGYSGAFNADDSYDVVHGCSICVTPAGSATLYSTFGNTLLGVIIDHVGHDTYGLGYQGLYDLWMHDPGGLGTLVPAHDNSDLELAEGSEGSGYWNDIGWKLPAGGFISNILDLANFTRGLLNDVYITRTTFQMMWNEQIPSGSVNQTCGENTDHGFYSHISVYPNHNASIVILTNTIGAKAAIDDIFNGISDLVLCPDNRNFTNDISWNEPRVFEGEKITGQSVITSDNDDAFYFDADDWVKLLPGFQAPAGKVFRALVTDGCGGTLHTD